MIGSNISLELSFSSLFFFDSLSFVARAQMCENTVNYDHAAIIKIRRPIFNDYNILKVNCTYFILRTHGKHEKLTIALLIFRSSKSYKKRVKVIANIQTAMLRYSISKTKSMTRHI